LATLIEFFDVPPSADAAFLADWQRERGTRGATLYRAIRDDAPVRFVSVAAGDSYELVHEDGAVDEPGGVIVCEPFEVPEPNDEPFLDAWSRRRDVLATQRGYLGSRLYRAVRATERRFVAVARWSSPLMVHRAKQRPEVQHAAVPFRSHPVFYQRIRP